MGTIRGRATSFLLALFLLFFTVSSTARAAGEEQSPLGNGRYWRKFDVHGAQCGDGQQYSVFISAGDPTKVAFELMGGGACWNGRTCYVLPDTWVHPIPTVLEVGGILSPNPALSPITDYTTVYFPYCTGDVHLGKHVTHYVGKAPFYHTGESNITASIHQLVATREIDFSRIQHFLLAGFSAGAIGSLHHIYRIAPLLTHVQDKVLIADAPGLHFGPKFWGKFTPELLADIGDALSVVNIPIHPGDGNIASLIPRVCSLYPDWRIGVLQGARDVIMSLGFGAISEKDHKEQIYGPKGVFQLTSDPNDNCSAWVPDTQMHTFMVTNPTADIRASNGQSAMDYVRALLRGDWGRTGSGQNIR